MRLPPSFNEMHFNRYTTLLLISSFLIAGASCNLEQSLFATASPQVQPLPTFNTDDLVSQRDTDPSYSEEDAEHITLESGTVRITAEGTYILEGTLRDGHIEIDAEDEDKIHLVLAGIDIECDNIPAIEVLNADKVFITLKEGSFNRLYVTGSSDLNATPSAIHSKDDLTVNGSGTLDITSAGNAIVCTDEVVITGGNILIDCEGCAVQTKESVVITDADINVTSCYDGLHAENEYDGTLGFVVISGGTISINAQDDAVHGSSSVTVTGGEFILSGSECIESTYVRIDDGIFDFDATGDGINAGRKSDCYYPTIEINGGNFTIVVARGDTDGIDSNGDLILSGGSFNISAESPFDWDGELTCTGGTFIVNGEETDRITNQDP